MLEFAWIILDFACSILVYQLQYFVWTVARFGFLVRGFDRSSCFIISLCTRISFAFSSSPYFGVLTQIDYSTILYRVIKWCNLITFVILRFGALLAIFYGMWLWPHRVPVLYYVLLALSCFIMSIINCVLFKRLAYSDIFRKQTPKKETKDGQDVKDNKHMTNGNVTTSNGNITTNNNDVKKVSE